MSREIKLRAWSNEHNRYCDFVTLDEKGRWIGWIKSSGVYLTTTDIILEQDTRLKDKNDKKICEGDIMRLDSEWYSCHPLMLIYYNNERLCFNLQEVKNEIHKNYEVNSLTGKYFEVIGNIHENPELLGGEE